MLDCSCSFLIVTEIGLGLGVRVVSLINDKIMTGISNGYIS